MIVRFVNRPAVGVSFELSASPFSNCGSLFESENCSHVRAARRFASREGLFGTRIRQLSANHIHSIGGQKVNPGDDNHMNQTAIAKELLPHSEEIFLLGLTKFHVVVLLDILAVLLCLLCIPVVLDLSLYRVPFTKRQFLPSRQSDERTMGHNISRWLAAQRTWPLPFLHDVFKRGSNSSRRITSLTRDAHNGLEGFDSDHSEDEFTCPRYCAGNTSDKSGYWLRIA